MPCRWTTRRNLREYCSCCSWGTRKGCLLEDKKDRDVRHGHIGSMKNCQIPEGLDKIRMGRFVQKLHGHRTPTVPDEQVTA